MDPIVLIGVMFVALVGLLCVACGGKKEEKKPDEVIEIRRFGGKPLDSKSVKFRD